MKTSNLIFWGKIAELAGIKNPGARAALVMRKWGGRDITPDTSKKIIADLTAECFPAHVSGADIVKMARLNPIPLLR